jgi:hypothetical protein
MNTWVSAHSTYNYLMKDPLLDWLNHHYIQKRKKSSSSSFLNKKDSKLDPYVMQLGKFFEKKVIKYITKRFEKERVYHVHPDHKKLLDGDDIYYKDTIRAMKLGYPIIFSGVVKSEKHKVYGIPDILVRSDWLHLLTKEGTDCNQKKTKAKKLNKHNAWHYIVVDIKYTTIALRSDKTHILNTGSFPAYKSQLYIYNLGLGEMQGYTPNQAFLLGRRYTSKTKKDKETHNNCFSKLGTIDYGNLDKGFIDRTHQAIAWIRDVKNPLSRTWNVVHYPLHRWELYPNMSNHKDHPWHEVKVALAEKNKEVTMLWNIGTKHRDIALQNGLCSWDQCKTKDLGISKKSKIEPVIASILHINKKSKSLMLPKYMKHNVQNWKEQKDSDFFIDFENADGSFIGSTSMPFANTEKCITTIGVGRFLFDQKKIWDYVCFTTENGITLESEYDMLHNFYSYMKKQKGKDNFRWFHWSKAEPSMWRAAMERHEKRVKRWKWSFEWVDMLDIFKKEPIVLKGCFSYKLKEIAQKMYDYGFIETIWDKANHTCTNGMDAIIQTIKASKKTDGTTQKLWNEIKLYNEIDVKVIAEIMDYLREHKIKKEGCNKNKKLSLQKPRLDRKCKKQNSYSS